MRNIFSKSKPAMAERVAAFWQWFEKNEASLFDYASNPEKVCNLVAKELDKVHPLAFEFGPGQDGKMDFVISADGVKKDFTAVAALCKAAPQLPRWNILAFRQRKDAQAVLKSSGVSISLDDCAFTAEKPGEGIIDLVFYMKGLTDDKFEQYGSAGFIILDSLLGEFDVATKIGAIEFEALTSEIMAEKKPRPIGELRSIFDESPSSSIVDGAWSGHYQYVVGDEEFPFEAQLKQTGVYLEGKMQDNSDLGPAILSGIIKESTIVFEKRYGRPDIDPVIYFGQIGADGKSMSGVWELETPAQVMQGVWCMKHGQ